MKNLLINFRAIDWEIPGIGVKQKIYSDGNSRLRLIHFSDDFVEKEWCLKGHQGYVLEGEMDINFSGNKKSYKKGDGLWIETGESEKHKVIIEKGKFVELILFERV